PDQIKQVLINLFLRARDDMPEGGNLTISTTIKGSKTKQEDEGVSDIWAYDQSDDQDTLVISVSDTGRGIPSSELKYVFDPF
nr:hybrid sensor histidine kinase/response regulator [Desulfobacterales bacterium]